MRGIVPRCVAITLAGAGALSTAACGCPTVAGPTAPRVTVSATLAPGEFRYVDVETPTGTTQLNVDFSVSSTTAPIRVWQVDPTCVPIAADTCPVLFERLLTARPAGVTAFGAGGGFLLTGARTRIVVQNASAEETITLTMTVEPHRAGCT